HELFPPHHERLVEGHPVAGGALNGEGRHDQQVGHRIAVGGVGRLPPRPAGDRERSAQPAIGIENGPVEGVEAGRADAVVVGEHDLHVTDSSAPAGPLLPFLPAVCRGREFPMTSEGFGTRAIHAGQRPDPTTGAIMTPVYLTSTYTQESPGKLKEGYDYSRSGNPTRTALEKNLASLEGARHGLCFASGCAALDAVLHQFEPGARVIVSDDVSGGTNRLANRVYTRHGLDIRMV